MYTMVAGWLAWLAGARPRASFSSVVCLNILNNGTFLYHDVYDEERATGGRPCVADCVRWLRAY